MPCVNMTSSTTTTTTVRSRNKIALVGSGQIGAMLGLLSGLKNLGDVYLFDVVPGVPMGKSLDLNHLGAVEGTDCRFYGTNDVAVALKDADVVIVTAGVPRKPGMSRDDLLEINGSIIADVAQGIKTHCKNAFVICITNPLDAMVQHLQRLSGLPHNKVCGMSGVLDSSRFQHFLAEKLNVSLTNISAMVIGGHGDAMVPLPRYTTVSGVNLHDLITVGLLSKQDIEEIVQRTRNAGGEIVEYLKMGSAFFAPAASAIRMAESYLLDRKCLLPAAVHLSGQYGVHDLYVGVPCIIGGAGVERVVELPLSAEETAAFQTSVDGVKALVAAMESLAAKKTAAAAAASAPSTAASTPAPKSSQNA